MATSAAERRPADRVLEAAAAPATRHRATWLISLRWLILIVFLADVLRSLYVDPNQPSVPVWLPILDLLACTTLLASLKTFRLSNLWAWIILFVFIDGYFLKSGWLASKVQTAPALVVAELRQVGAQTIATSYVWITAAFIVFCVLGAALLRFPERDQRNLERPPVDPRPNLVVSLTLLSFAIYCVCAVLDYGSGNGVLGLVSNGSLFNTITSRIRQDVAPAVLLLCFWLHDRRGSRWAAVTVVLLVAATAIDAFVTTSRGSSVRFLVPLFFLWVAGGRGTRRAAIVMAAAVIATLAAYPVISNLRLARLGVVDAGLPQQSLLDTVTVPLFRVQGIEGVWLSLAHVPAGFDVGRAATFLASGTDVLYYTQRVAGVTAPGDYRAPGIIGAFMLLGNLAFVVALTFAYVLLVFVGWRLVSRLRCAPVALSLSGSVLLIFTSEGTLRLSDLVSVVLVIALIEFVLVKVIGARGESQSPSVRRATPRLTT